MVVLYQNTFFIADIFSSVIISMIFNLICWFCVCSNDGQQFNGSVFQKVDSALETGIQVSWTAGSNATQFGIGCKYSLDKEASLRAKVNNSFQVGLGYQQKLRDGKLFPDTTILIYQSDIVQLITYILCMIFTFFVLGFISFYLLLCSSL